ncbi:MAG: EAL domain-containing protein [Pseudomonadales bacterium]|nr:EAL domain-containing protein [Pseudomonadales bacterium]
MHNTLQLLIFDQSDNMLEELIRTIRDSGQALYTHTIQNLADLESKLDQHQWDLCCITNRSDHALSPATIFSQIKSRNLDLPALLLFDQSHQAELGDIDPVSQALNDGYVDASPLDQIERIQHILKREIENLRARRINRAAESRLDESEERCQLLLESSDDGIAYIHEGMHIYANQQYLSLFGYPSMEELEATPIMDLVGTTSRDLFKRQLKSFGNDEQEAVDFQLSAKRADGTEFELPVSLIPAVYDGETCIQLVLRGETSHSPAIQTSSTRDSTAPSGGILSRRELLNLLTQRVEQAGQTEQIAAFGYLSIENMSEIVDNLGLLGYEQLLEQIDVFLSRHLEPELSFAHHTDHVFMILCSSSTKEELYSWAEKLCGQLIDHTFEVDHKSLHLACSFGISRITDPQETIEAIVVHSEQAAYTAGGQDNGSAAVFIHETNETADKSAALAQLDDFKDAMVHQALFLMYEPVIGLRGIGGELYELHTGILDSDGNELFGEKLYALAEEAGWRAKFDRWNILNGIKALSTHIAKGHDTALFIKVSHHSLCDESLVPWIGVALKAAAIPSNRIIFQITEFDASTYLKQSKLFVEGINKINCRAAINEFGIGRDPLRTLQHLDADYVVMAPMFTEDYDGHQDKFTQLVGALQAEGKLIMVPGIDSPGFVSKLWQLGINYIQGPYLQEPHSQMDYEFDLEAG